MSWQVQWQALSRRIAGFLEAVEIFSTLFRATEETGASGKYEHINRVLLPQAKDVLIAVNELGEAYGDVLPHSAKHALQSYKEKVQSTPATGLPALLGMATILATMKSELDYLLADQEAAVVAVVERAFEHLQRTIVIDDAQRKRWHIGFSDKEPQCEKMGAVHLLWHGIWAFKINADGERTDLVLGVAIGESAAERVRASGARLVLTEWKLVRHQNRLNAAIKQAVNQLKLYSQGSLAGIELRSTRYVVVVSEARLVMPLDQTTDGILYRFVNIVTAPQPPSKSHT